MTLSVEEEALINEKMRDLSPDFEMFRLPDFKRAIATATKALDNDPAIWLTPENGKPYISLPLLCRRVVTDLRLRDYGVPLPWWWIFQESQLLQGIQHDPWSEVKWWLWNSMRGKGEVLTIHGSQNSLKSSWMSRFAVVQMATWLRDAEVYVSGPFKLHADDKVWGGESGIYTWIKFLRQNPNVFTRSLGLSFQEQSDTCTVSDKRTGSTGTAKFVAMESAAAVQGKKSATHDETGLLGIVLLLIDEFIENPGLKIKQAKANTVSNFNFFGVLSCNPLPDKVKHPALLKFSAPADRPEASLSRERDFLWRTSHGWCARFAWANCPNRLLGRTVWPYMLSQIRVDRSREEDRDLVDSQIEAWAWGTGSRNSGLDEAAIRMAATYSRFREDFVWDGPTRRFIHIDCAFGGHDPATATILEYGPATLSKTTGGNNYPVQRNVFHGLSQEVIPVDGDWRPNREELDEMKWLFEYTGGAWPETVGVAPVKAGDPLGGNWHLCYQVMKILVDQQIASTDVSFDSSQRADCTVPMLHSLGMKNVRWYYEGTRRIVQEENLPPTEWYVWPYEYEEMSELGQQRPKKWSDVCTQTISMIWLFACNLIRHGYLVGGENVAKGLDELCARQIIRGRAGQTEGRKDVMGKEKLKEMGQKSPTWGEGLATALYFGHRFLGLCPLEGPKLSTSVKMPVTPMSIIRAPGMNRRYGAKESREEERALIAATYRKPEYRPLSQAERAMNALAFPDGGR